MIGANEEQEQPSVSVIIPAYNAAATILDTLRSVSAQTYPNLEILVVDDGSRDDTARVVEQYALTEPRLRLIVQANAGAAAARNLAIEHARGRFIAPIDADDLWHPTRVEKHMAILERDDGLGFVYSPFRLLNAAGRVIASHPRFDFAGWVFHRQLFFNMVGNGSGMTFNREAAIRVGGYDNALREAGLEGCEDWLLQMRLCLDSPIGHVPDYLIGYRKTPNAMSADTGKIWQSQILAADLIKAHASPAQREAIEKAKLHFQLRQALVSVRKPDLDLLLRAGGGAVARGMAGGAIGELSEAVLRARRAKARRRRPPGAPFLEVDPTEPGDTNLSPYVRRLIEHLGRLDQGACD